MRETLLPFFIALLALSPNAAAVTRTVNTSGDVSAFDGLTTLREAVEASAAGDTVDFAPALAGKTIFLDQGEIALEKSISIAGDSFLGRPIISAAKINDSSLSSSRPSPLEVFRESF